jgi:predicted lipoprotein with Yx(FWY)xxD motif
MTRSRSITLLASAAVIPLSALALAACGGGSNSGASATAAAPHKAMGARPATIGVGSSGLGKILVDSQGRTLYLFKKDQGAKSACGGACATEWPPLRASGKPTVGMGAKAAMVGTTARSDGRPQVTYNGHPLYTFTGDQKAGDTQGQGVDAFGARWYALSPQGNQVSGQQASSGGGSSSGGGTGY